MTIYTKLELWKEHGPPVLMALLLDAVKRRTTITYTEAARLMGDTLDFTVNKYHVGGVAGTLMDMIWGVDEDAPPINMLVINKKRKLPGDGADWFMKKYLGGERYDAMSDDRKRATLLPVRQKIFEFEDWPRIARKLFGQGLPVFAADEPPGENDGKSRRAGNGGAPESPEHKRLKGYVAKNGRSFGAPARALSEIEWGLPSGDELDVWFMTPDEQLGVEVKSARSNDEDLQRGLYQCIKYRAVMEAQLLANAAKGSVRVLLVTERSLSDDLRDKARRLKVAVREINPLS